jgi:hypothetical protein
MEGKRAAKTRISYFMDFKEIAIRLAKKECYKEDMPRLCAEAMRDLQAQEDRSAYRMETMKKYTHISPKALDKSVVQDKTKTSIVPYNKFGKRPIIKVNSGVINYQPPLRIRNASLNREEYDSDNDNGYNTEVSESSMSRVKDITSKFAGGEYDDDRLESEVYDAIIDTNENEDPGFIRGLIQSVYQEGIDEEKKQSRWERISEGSEYEERNLRVSFGNTSKYPQKNNNMQRWNNETRNNQYNSNFYYKCPICGTQCDGDKHPKQGTQCPYTSDGQALCFEKLKKLSITNASDVTTVIENAYKHGAPSKDIYKEVAERGKQEKERILTEINSQRNL